MSLPLSASTLLLAKARNREACSAVAKQVYRVVAAVLGPASPDVADVTQVAFMRVFDKIDLFEDRGAASPKAWVNAVAARVAIDHRRSARRAPWMVSFDDDGHDAGERDSEPVELGALVSDAELVRVLLEELTEEERAVLVLRYWSGMTDADAAASLGIPLGTLKTRVRRASEKLRSLAREGAFER